MGRDHSKGAQREEEVEEVGEVEDGEEEGESR